MTSVDDGKAVLGPADYACFDGDLPYTLVTGASDVAGSQLMHYAVERAPAAPRPSEIADDQT